jgi:hypothetical protein
LAAYDQLVGEASAGVHRAAIHTAPANRETSPAPQGAPPPVLRLGVEADAPPESTDAIEAFASGRPGAVWESDTGARGRLVEHAG